MSVVLELFTKMQLLAFLEVRSVLRSFLTPGSLPVSEQQQKSSCDLTDFYEK